MSVAVALQPDDAPACKLCGPTRAWRRGLCRSCYRKLREAGVPLDAYPDGRAASPQNTPFSRVQWLRSLFAGVPDGVRLVREVLSGLEAAAPAPEGPAPDGPDRDPERRG